MDAAGWLDAHGMPAYTCARDGGGMRLAPGADFALECTDCGYRTDAPGLGTLGDAFDVTHRQWGLRGDPHVWNAIRDALADAPTPPDPDSVRRAFVDAIRDVAQVDVDDAPERVVYRAHLNHGGMSGGSVDTLWWRTKGLPLLVERALARRPAR